MSNLLEVNGLKKYFNTKAGQLHAVDDVSFKINAGNTLALSAIGCESQLRACVLLCSCY